MNGVKTRGIEKIDKKMSEISEDSIRYKILKSAKSFKSSWMELGQALYLVWKQKSYKEWGYITFEAYTQKEIGIRKATAIKLLKSYYFLEQEEPVYIEKGRDEDSPPTALPTYDSVNILRLAKNKNQIDRTDYQNLRKDVLEKGKDAREVKKELTTMLRQREELEPEEARQKRRSMVIKRLLGVLKTLKTEIEVLKILPVVLIKEVSSLISKVESEA